MLKPYNSYSDKEQNDSKVILEFFSHLEETVSSIQKRRDSIPLVIDSVKSDAFEIVSLQGSWVDFMEYNRKSIEEFLQESQKRTQNFLHQIRKNSNSFLNISRASSKIFLFQTHFFTGNFVWKDQEKQKEFIYAFQKIFHNLMVFIDLNTSKYKELIQRHWLEKIELFENIFVRLVQIFIQNYEKIEKWTDIDIWSIDIEANIVSQICQEIKQNSKWVNILNIPFFSYVNGPNISWDLREINPQIFQKIEELYKINYAHEPEFLEKIIPIFRKKLTWTCEFKTLYWDKIGEKDFDKKPENLVWALYFSPLDVWNVKKTEYLGWVNLDPNFHKSWIASFIKKAIAERFENGTHEIQLDVIWNSDAEQMWRSLWFEYVSQEFMLKRANYSSLSAVKYKLTKEKFNQVFAKSR